MKPVISQTRYDALAQCRSTGKLKTDAEDPADPPTTTESADSLVANRRYNVASANPCHTKETLADDDENNITNAIELQDLGTLIADSVNGIENASRPQTDGTLQANCDLSQAFAPGLLVADNGDKEDGSARSPDEAAKFIENYGVSPCKTCGKVRDTFPSPALSYNLSTLPAPNADHR